MHLTNLERWRHDHTFGTELETSSETRTRWVVALTFAMMVGEIAAGLAFGSMALLADGWHMGTHAAALCVTAFAYAYARRHARSSHYSFGTGKVGALGGFASAIGLAVVALMVFGESAWRLAAPVSIRFDEAIAVAVLGLLVNLVSALLLQAPGEHGHDHGPHEHHESHVHDDVHPHEHHDHNLRAAYLHVLADALTSVLALAALTTGKYLGWMWMDPAMGLVGSMVIARWSYGLLVDTSRVLLDAEADEEACAAIRRLLESEADNRVSDLHLWRVGPSHLAAIVSVVTRNPQSPAHYKDLLRARTDLSHVTVEVHSCPGEQDLPHDHDFSGHAS